MITKKLLFILIYVSTDKFPMLPQSILNEFGPQTTATFLDGVRIWLFFLHERALTSNC